MPKPVPIQEPQEPQKSETKEIKEIIPEYGKYTKALQLLLAERNIINKFEADIKANENKVFGRLNSLK